MNAAILFYLRRFPLSYGKACLSKFINWKKLPFEIKYTNKQGVIYNLDLKEYQMRQIFLYDYYEANTVYQLKKLIAKRSIGKVFFFDVGANIGFYSLTVAKLLEKQDAEIHCFEPNPFTLNILNNNIEANNYKSIFINNLGLSDSSGILKLHFNRTNLGTASLYNNANTESVDIKLIALDDYCDAKNIRKINFLKVDVEGAEYAFLKGAEKIIRQSEEMILIMEIVEENCSKAGYSSDFLFKYVTSMGFEAYLPKPWPRPLKKISQMPLRYHDNIFFVKGFN